MKKIVILGVGAQGSTVAKKLDKEPNVKEIICADCDKNAVNELVSALNKCKGEVIDGGCKEDIIRISKGADLIINALPLDFGKIVLEAALEVKANYQDFAACENIVDTPDHKDSWVEGIKVMYRDYSKRFEEIGKCAIIGTGSAPGLMCIVARLTVEPLDECETINMMVYEGVKTKRFIPYWWSPFVALCDMEEDAYAFENGKIIRTKPFSMPIKRKWKEYDYEEIVLVEHAHDEPVYIGLNSDTYFKGVKNAYFKYGGVGIEFAHPIYAAGLLSKEKEDIKGQSVAPFDVILSHIPPAPKYPKEIKEIIDEGIITDNGAFVCECIGRINQKDVMVESHVFAPGLVDSYERTGMSAEMYLTGQSGYLFTKLFISDLITQKGLISSDMLEKSQIDQYINWAKELDITIETQTKNL